MIPSAKNTYCNPLPIPQMPRGLDVYYADFYGMFDPPENLSGKRTPDFRSLADPTVFYHDNKWYLYPSYGMAWVSEDFVSWKHIRTSPYCSRYSPCITAWKGKFLLTGSNCPLYVGDSPVGPFEEKGDFIKPDGSHFIPCDPCIFTDDDGRIYMYEVGFDLIKKPNIYHTCILGYELDPDDPRKILQGPVLVMDMDPATYVFERHGHRNQDPRFGWIEGPHLLKHNGRYYLIYSAPNTEYSSYVQAVAYSDAGPLAPMQRQMRNPLTASKHGVVSGAGHGCVEHGPNGSLWAFYTVTAPYAHMCERRIGMDLVQVDENGELYCPNGVTDTPQYAPGIEKDGEATGLMALNGWCRPGASSCAPGRDALYAVDESPLSWWQPADGDSLPTLTCKLDTDFHVCASRIWWRDVGMHYGKGILPGPIQYCIEGLHNDEWVTLLNRTASDEDLNIDYQSFDAVQCTQVRLVITGHPENITPGVIDFTVFGTCPSL